MLYVPANDALSRQSPRKARTRKVPAQAIADGSLGQGSIAGDEYGYDMAQARAGNDGVIHWAETCFCDAPLAEERPYWEKYFDLLRVKDAHNRKNCRHENGTEPWTCTDCNCTKRREERLQRQGRPFLKTLRDTNGDKDG